jgi:sugar phosphate isomerase/epimerase
MRLGGPVFVQSGDPDEWIAALRQAGYRAAYCPVGHEADSGIIQAFAAAAQAADIVIAEVGAWSNPISPDDVVRRAAVEKCQRQLALADEIGALCCVNIAGSRGTVWDGPHPDNLSPATFDLIVETTRQIIDAVRPKRTCFTLETMPWVFPDSVESYLALIEAIDRPQFAVHLDPVNLISSPQRFFANGALIHECFTRLGPYIKSCHAKDIQLSTKLTVHLDEVRPGLGALDYQMFLREMDRLPADTPLMLEHLQEPDDYRLTADYVRSVAAQVGVRLL